METIDDAKEKDSILSAVVEKCGQMATNMAALLRTDTEANNQPRPDDVYWAAMSSHQNTEYGAAVLKAAGER